MEKKSFRQTGKGPCAKSKVIKKPAKKKTTDTAESDQEDQEVELDSLGSFFIHLINNDYQRDDAEASRADHVEVISLSSGSDHVPVQKFRRAV